MGLYIVASYRAAPLLTRLANIFLTGALYMGWYSFCTSSWGRVFPNQQSSDHFVGYGLWRIGDNQVNKNGVMNIQATDGWLSEWYGAFQAFATLGFVSVNVAYFLLVLVVYVAPCKADDDLLFWNAVNNVVGCVCWLVAVVLFGVKFKDTFDQLFLKEPVLHYSFYLAVIVCAFQLITAIFLFLARRKGTPVETA